MTVESNNPDTGIDNDAPQADDTAEEWDYFDPEEDTEEAPETEATDDGTAEAEEAPETEEPEEGDDPETPEVIEAPADAVVTMADGTKVPVKELVQGNLRQSDYTRKVQEVATQRKALETEVQRLEGITEAFVDHLTGLVPPAPTTDLLYSDEKAYFRQKALHEKATEKLKELIDIGQQPKAMQEGLTKQQLNEEKARQNLLLQEKFPEIAIGDGRKKFFEQAVETAEQIGFTIGELEGVTDHRLFEVLHYASLGLKAKEAKVKAKAKVVSAPPVAPLRRGQGAGAVGKNAEAAKRFRSSPTIENAVAAWDGD